MNVTEFDKVAREIFAPVYVAIAEQIKERTGITDGICLDVGAGGGYLGLALAPITSLHILFLDNSRAMLDIAVRNAITAGLESRVGFLFGDVHRIPFNDELIDLVVSRGSVFFWKDKIKAFNEIYRVLVPGGKAYIGGGLGTPEIAKQVRAKINKTDKAWPDRKGKDGDSQKACSEALKKSCITDWTIKRSDAGLWIEIWK